MVIKCLFVVSYSICEVLELDESALQLNEAAEDITFSKLASCIDATEHDITFVNDSKYLSNLENTQAKSVIIGTDLDIGAYTGIVIQVKDAYVAYAKVSRLFSTVPAADSCFQTNIHATASIAPSAKIGERVYVGANAVVEADVVLSDDVQIWPGAVINAQTHIGKASVIKSNVTVYHNCVIGEHCLIHSGTVIGSDGFGFAPSSEGWQKIYQNGSVIVGSHVEIGANCSIDRGAISDTQISDGVIIDNLVHIAHNVEIGENTAIAGQTGVAGSTKIGKNCTIAGQCGFAGHLEITDNSHFTGQAMVTKSIKEPGVYSSGFPLSDNKTWRRVVARIRNIDELTLNVKKLLKLQK